MMMLTLLAVNLGFCATAAGQLYHRVEWGDRVQFLVQEMEDSDYKTQLETCLGDADVQPRADDFSIGHRGACLQYPEHTAESYQAAIYQGAGIVECDVAVTSDGELVCRHSQCDLHTTTNILLTSLAPKCTEPFAPATDNSSASASCCTSDITLAEYKTLCGKMDASVSTATTAEEYVGGTADFRTDLYAACGTLVSHAESIEIIKNANRKFTPELKTYTQGVIAASYDEIRAKLIQEYEDAAIPWSSVWPQSFNKPDIDFWIENYPDTFGQQAVFLDGSYCDGTTADCPQIEAFASYQAEGINYIAPPMQMLVKVEDSGYAASDYAIAAKEAGLKIITWTLERSGPLSAGNGGFYYSTSLDYSDNDGRILEILYTLSLEVGVEGVFSDWPATTTFFANCVLKSDDASWTKNCVNDEDCADKDCKWVASFPEKRCFVRGPGGRNDMAMDSCQNACNEIRRRLAQDE